LHIVPDDVVLEEASAASYQVLSKKSKLRKNLRVNENQLVKDSERNTMSESEVNESET
jgi:hypothetical protein